MTTPSVVPTASPDCPLFSRRYFFPPDFILPSVSSSSRKPGVSDTYSRFRYKSFRTLAVLLAVHSRDFLHLELLIIKATDSVPF